MKLSSPKLPLQLENGSIDLLYMGEVEGVLLQEIEAKKCNVQALDLDGVVIAKSNFSQAQFLRITAKDIIAKQSDFSSVAMADGAFNRAEFVNCRMTGVDFSKASIHDVVFQGCKLDLANFRFADVRRVKFIDCTFVEADFLGATMHGVSFESSVLERTTFDQVKTKQLDLRSSQLIGISGWGSLRDATIDEVQLMMAAPQLASEMGLVVSSEV